MTEIEAIDKAIKVITNDIKLFEKYQPLGYSPKLLISKEKGLKDLRDLLEKLKEIQKNLAIKIDLENYEGFVVKVVLRNGTIHYGKIERNRNFENPYYLNLGSSIMVYNRDGCAGGTLLDLDIIKIEKAQND